MIGAIVKAANNLAKEEPYMNYGTATAEESNAKYASDVRQMKTVKRPGFIKRWLLRSIKEAATAEQSDSAKVSERPRAGLAVERASLDSQPMHLKIYRANGGTIIETSTYDRQKDRHGNQLHIIGHDTDLGQGIAKIITMESLRG